MYEDLLINTCTVQSYTLSNVVIGTDGNNYYCKADHLAANDNKPITGANYALYWTLTGVPGVAWVIGTNYTASFDVYNQPVKVWADIYTNEPCRLVSGKGREIKVGQQVHIVHDQLFLKDISITVQDRVIINALTYEVVDVLFRQTSTGHHKEAYLEIVK